MSTVRGGDIQQFMLGGREFEVAAEANVTYRLSGYTNESNPTGSGGMHTTQTRKLGGIDSIPLSVQTDRGDVEFIQDLADEGEPVPCSMTLINGDTYAGRMTVQEAVDPNTGDGQVEITLAGAKFEKI